MAQRLRWLATLPEYPGSFPSTTWWLTTTYNSCCRGSGTLMYRECRHTCRQSIHMLQSLLSLIHTLHSTPVYLEGSGQLQFNPTAALECLDKTEAQRFVQKLCLRNTSNLLFLTKCSEAHDDSMVLLPGGPSFNLLWPREKQIWIPSISVLMCILNKQLLCFSKDRA